MTNVRHGVKWQFSGADGGLVKYRQVSSILMDLIAAYADYQRLLRGWSEPTIRRRTATLRQFERAITPDTLGTATEAQALAFLARYPRP